MWRARRWRELLNLIDHLPQNSFYYHALMNDPEHARLIAEWEAQNPDQPNPGPGWQTWSPEVAKLTELLDAVHVLTAATIAGNGGKPGKIVPSERPRSVLAEEREKATMRRKRSVYDRIVAKVLPHKAKNPT